jgi:hypothetical protein
MCANHQYTFRIKDFMIGDILDLRLRSLTYEY